MITDYKTFPDLSIHADEQGRPAFKESFKNYMNRHQPDLFTDSELYLENSQSSKLIQVADLLVGTFGMIYDPKFQVPESLSFLQVMREKALFMDEWPPKISLNTISIDDSSTDNFIKSFSEQKVRLFLENNQHSSEDDIQLQVIVVKYLLFHSKVNPGTYLYGDRIINYIKQILNVEEFSKENLRSNIISKLRDGGVIISSCSQGYKIPVNERELSDYVHQIETKVVPMLKRLNMAREDFKTASKNELDIVDFATRGSLKNLMDHLGDKEISSLRTSEATQMPTKMEPSL